MSILLPEEIVEKLEPSMPSSAEYFENLDDKEPIHTDWKKWLIGSIEELMRISFLEGKVVDNFDVWLDKFKKKNIK